MTIRITHTVAEKLRNGEWTHSENLVCEAPLTARGIARANRALDEDRAYYARHFGPGTISPRHGVRVEINGQLLDPMFQHEIARMEKRDGWSGRDVLETWGDVAKRLS